MYESLAARTVRITAHCTGVQQPGWGSGVIIQTGIVATAAHVLKPGCELRARGVVARPAAIDLEADVALLVAPGLPPWAQVEASVPYTGQWVVTVGFPAQLLDQARPYMSVSPGYLATDLGRWYRVTAPAYYGNSGGGVFDDRGRLVGLFVAMHTAAPIDAPVDGMYYAAPARVVFRLLEAL